MRGLERVLGIGGGPGRAGFGASEGAAGAAGCDERSTGAGAGADAGTDADTDAGTGAGTGADAGEDRGIRCVGGGATEVTRVWAKGLFPGTGVGADAR